jgi:D-glycero-alpha-D-manno-heptose-7-phosphate kinase
MSINVRSMLDQSLHVTRVRARAPLRLGLAGGGTDVSPYCDEFGGYVLNAAISMYAQASITVRTDGLVRFEAVDRQTSFEATPDFEVDPRAELALHQGVYKRIVRDYLGGAPLSVTVTTYCDAPAGSGLGSSSTLVVAMIEAYRELLALPLGEYDVAQLAYDIERVDIGQAGGKQDQYSATFGGVNFMEFGRDRVIVNPLRVRDSTLFELEAMTVLYFTGISRQSASIIQQQRDTLSRPASAALDAMHEIKRDALEMKEALLRNDIDRFASILNRSWESKKRTASGIANQEIDRVFDLAMGAGARAGKVSGAGGGGFMFFIVEPTRRPDVLRALKQEPGAVMTCSFSHTGAQAWRA